MEQMLPNALVGLEYDHECNGTFEDDQIAPGLMLLAGRIVGVPTEPGDYSLVDVNTSAKYSLTIIPDPRLLWKEKEPEDPAYAKPHRVHSIKSTDDDYIFGVSIRGRQHAHVGSYREDDYTVVIHDTTTAICVADGLGSAHYSRLASAIAIELVSDLLPEWAPPEYFGDDHLTAESVLSFVAKIELALLKRLKDEGIDLADSKTTFSLCLIDQCDDKTSHISTYSAGDSVIAALSKEEVELFSNVHSGEFAGATKYFGQFPLDPDDIFTGYIGDDSIAVLLMTDGISDSQFNSENELRQRGNWDSLLSNLKLAIAEQKEDRDSKALCTMIDTYEPTHHDDRTLAGMVSKRWLEC